MKNYIVYLKESIYNFIYNLLYKLGAKRMEELSIKDLMKMFGVTLMTITNWRKGSTRITPLPTETRARGSRNQVYFTKEKVLAWAKENEINLVESVK